MEFTPHTPSMLYKTSGFPLSSEDAFKIFSNGLEINSLTTEHKTIVGAINELKYDIDNIDLSDYLTKAEAEATYAKITDLDDYVSESVYNTFVSSVTTGLSNLDTRVTSLESRTTALEGRVLTVENDIDTITDRLSDVIAELPNQPITINLDTFTNPAYFTQDEKYLLRSTPYSVDFSYLANVLQDIDPTDGILEVVNISLTRDTVDIDLNDSPRHFYIPATVDNFDSNGNFISTTPMTLDCELTQEMNGYDISVYVRGTISNVNQYTKLKFSGSVPYTGVNRRVEQSTPNVPLDAEPETETPNEP